MSARTKVEELVAIMNWLDVPEELDQYQRREPDWCDKCDSPIVNGDCEGECIQ